MDSWHTDDIRTSFVNCSKGEAASLPLPKLDDVDWEQRDFLGWRHSRTPQRAYVVTPRPDGPVGMVLRVAESRSTTGAMRTSMCELCQTIHSSGGVVLFTAAKAKRAARAGDSIGAYFCADLECSRYVRGLKRPIRVQPMSTLTVDERIERLNSRLNGLVTAVLAV